MLNNLYIINLYTTFILVTACCRGFYINIGIIMKENLIF